MINNRQNGRRRGRGGPRPQGNPGQPGGGNRIDNRARGNAAQLHEKYRNLARDSQLAGDRVTTEYYLQFADHYFRVLSESRARFEDQNQGQGQNRPRGDGDDDFDGGDEFDARDNRDMRDNRDVRDNRDQGQRRDRDYRQDRDDRQPEAAQPAQQGDGEMAEQRPSEGQRQARGNPRRRREEVVTQSGDAPEGFDADRLPPAIAVASDDGEEAPAPRRRGRRPRTEAANDVEIPPAA